MPRVHIPSMLRKHTEGLAEVEVEGKRIDAVIENLENRFPGIRNYLCREKELKIELNVSVDNKISSLRMLQPVSENSEIHFIPAVGGG